MLRVNLTGLVLGAAAVLFLFAAGAVAEEKADNWGAGALCPACAGKVFTADIGVCKSCGRGTSSGAFKLCQACGRKLGKCQACGAELKGEKSLLSFALVSLREKCTSIQEVKLTVVLMNESQKDIVVNSRMMCHAEPQPGGEGP